MHCTPATLRYIKRENGPEISWVYQLVKGTLKGMACGLRTPCSATSWTSTTKAHANVAPPGVTSQLATGARRTPRCGPTSLLALGGGGSAPTDRRGTAAPTRRHSRPSGTSRREWGTGLVVVEVDEPAVWAACNCDVGSRGEAHAAEGECLRADLGLL